MAVIVDLHVPPHLDFGREAVRSNWLWSWEIREAISEALSQYPGEKDIAVCANGTFVGGLHGNTAWRAGHGKGQG